LDLISGDSSFLLTQDVDRLRHHPDIGARIGRAIGLPAEAVQIIALHHERWDGTGYPFALKEERIPYLARLVALAQTFDELTSEQSGTTPVSLKKALALIEEQSGTTFDPSLVEVFCRTIRDQPPQIAYASPTSSSVY